MTGHLLIKSKVKSQKSKVDYFSNKVNQYVHHIFYLKAKSSKLKAESHGKTLGFSDLRKFGKIVLADTKKIMEIKEIKELGLDAMSKNFTFKKFNDILDKKSASRRKKIRDVLMDQSLIAGIGNIYASEILFEAGIVPTRPVSKIGSQKREKLFKTIKKVFVKAIKLRGTSDSDYRDTEGVPGKFQKVLKVYRQEGEKCRICGTIVKRIKMGQRSAFYCSRCQR